MFFKEALLARRGRYIYEWPRPMVTVDAAVFFPSDSGLKIALIRRAHEPFKGRWAMPGGFIELDEELEDAAARELEEETGLHCQGLEQLHTFGECGRDPRGRQISVVFTALARPGPDGGPPGLRAGDDAAEAAWFDTGKIPLPLAFDHERIINFALAAPGRHFSRFIPRGRN